MLKQSDLDINSSVLEKVKLLEAFNFKKEEINNIITSNPMILTSCDEDIIKLLEFLNLVGFSNLNLLIDSNPDILNLEVFEIENYIKNKELSGEDLEDIVDNLEQDPSLFNEM